MNYLLDANTYIQAKNQYYGFDFCPACWDWLDQQYALAQLGSVTLVYDELKKYGDELTSWVKARKEHFIAIDDSATQQFFAGIAAYVAEQDFNLRNRDLFLDGADPWLIAKAGLTDATVVTQESLAGQDSRKVKVPNICQVMGVDYIKGFELLRRLKAEFILPPQA